MFCPKCGSKLPEGVKFCPNCGEGVAAQNQNDQSSQNNRNSYQNPYTYGQGQYQNNQDPFFQNQGQYQNNQDPFFQNQWQYQYGQNPYQNPYRPPYYQPVQKLPGKGLGITSLVLGIIAILALGEGAVIFGILGLVFGIVSLNKAKEVGRKNGVALAGLICSIIALSITAFVFLIWFILVGAIF